MVRSETQGLIASFEEAYRLYAVAGSGAPAATLDIHIGDMQSYIRTESLPFDLDATMVASHYIFSGAWNPATRRAHLLSSMDNAFILTDEYLRMLLAQLLLEQGKVMFHCAALADASQDALYLCFAPSGIGKSTLARNTRQLQVLTDDLIILSRDAAGFIVEKTPFTRDKVPSDPARRYQLQGLYRIYQADHDQVLRLSAADGLLRVLGNMFQVYQSEANASRYLQTIFAMLGGVPCYDLFIQKHTPFETVIL
jgi:hypothetical protein